MIEASAGVSLDIESWLESEEGGQLQRHLEEKIMKFLFSQDPTDLSFQRMVVQLAWIGAEDKSLVEKEIAELKPFSEEEILQCGFWSGVGKTASKIGHFVKNNKKKILLGAALCATGFGLGLATGYGLGVSIGGIIVTGSGSTKEEKKKNPYIPPVAPPGSKEEAAVFQRPIFIPQLELPASPDQLLVTTTGIWVSGQFYSNEALLKQSLFASALKQVNPNWKEGNFLSFYPSQDPTMLGSLSTNQNAPLPNTSSNSTTGTGESRESLLPYPSIPLNQEQHGHPSSLKRSRPFTLPGIEKKGVRICWINGIDNQFAESQASASYIQELSGGYAVSGIYNHTNGILNDLLECCFLNHKGFSPNTAKLLVEEWTAFHEAHKDQPNAKLFQFCHSQGAIAVRNALRQVSPEIRNRIIVGAFAPAAVVPDHLCFKSFNYASERDFVHKLEPGPSRPVDSLTLDDVIIPHFGEAPPDHREELIILLAHPDAKNIDHHFQSLTFQDSLSKLLKDYHQHGGEYLPEEKGKDFLSKEENQ